MEAELVARLHEIAAMPPSHMLGWTIVIFGMPVAAILGTLAGR